MLSHSEIYDILVESIRTARRNGPKPGGDFPINTLDVLDILKLDEKDLVAKGFGESNAERLNTALVNGDVQEFAHAMGVTFVISHDVPSLFGNR